MGQKAYLAPRGTNDIYGKEIKLWQRLERVIDQVCADFCFEEIRTPIFEHTELFLRGVGETTDVVQKEMYTFTDKGDRSCTLRPEVTAGVARAFVEHKLYGGVMPLKFYYSGPNFRYEKPGQGRFRQFHQFGCEVFGSGGAFAETEAMMLAYEVIKGVGIKDFTLRINSLGCSSCRAVYNERLTAFLRERYDGLCATCKTRLEKNPLRILDCKEEKCQALLTDAPSVLDALDDECRKHFEDVKAALGVVTADTDLRVEVDPRIVRGLDYYTRTVFEFVDEKTGLTLCGGGRYDNLIEECGGPATSAVGFGMGMERIVMLMGDAQEDMGVPDIYIGGAGSSGVHAAWNLIYALRREGVKAEGDISGRSIKAQMKYADKLKARYSAIIGDNEIADSSVRIKNMSTGEEITAGLNTSAVAMIVRR